MNKKIDNHAEENSIQDLTAMETLFRRFYKPLRAYAFRYVNDTDLAEDVVQDVFYELWKHRTSIRFEDESLKSYLFKAVYTRSLNAINDRRDTCPLAEDTETYILDKYVTSHMQYSDQCLLLKELEDEINSYINTLPPQCLKIFRLSRCYELKNREIADQLGISVKAVEKQISKVLSGLKEHLIKKGLLLLLVLSLIYFYS